MSNSVQFREACSHYRPCDLARISYRYSVESDFKISPGDWIGVFSETANSIEDFLSSVSVGELSTHRLCDGGLFKTGSVSIKCPEKKTGSGEYRFWYVGSNTKEIFGKSDTFVLCVDDPSMSFGSMSNDQDILAAIHSPASEMVHCNDDGDDDLGSSFILVSEDDEFSGSQYVVAKLGEDVPIEHKGSLEISDSAGDKEKRKEEEEERIKEYDIMSSKEASSMSEYVLCLIPVPEPDLSDDTSQIEPEEPGCIVSSSSCLELTEKNHNENTTRFDSEVNSNASYSENIEQGSNSITKLPELDVINVPMSPAARPLPITTRAPQLDQETINSMSISTVETHITQREARLLKTSSRDLVQKIRKLTEILEKNKSGNEELSLDLNEREKRLQAQEERLLAQEERLLELEALNKRNEEELHQSIETIADLEKSLAAREKEVQKDLHQLRKKLNKAEEDKRKTEDIGKIFLTERSSFEEKIKQLSREKATAFERASKLLSQLQESETKRAVEKSEKQVLEGKIDYLSSELFAFKKPQRPVHLNTTRSNGRNIPPQSQEPKRFEDTSRQKNNPGKPAGLPLSARTKTAATQSQEKDEKTHFRRKKAELLTTAMPHSHNKPNSDLPLVNDKQIPLNKEDPQTLVLPINGHEREPHLKRDELISDALPTLATLAPAPQGKGLRGAGIANNGELSEERIAIHLREQNGSTTVQCPICMKQLCSRVNDYGVQLHVEHCLRLSEEAK